MTLSLITNILFSNSSNDQWPGSINHIVKSNIIVIENSLASESIKKGEHKMRKGKDQIFVKEIEYHLSIPQIRKSAMMH